MVGMPVANCRKRILIVDDDPHVLFVWRAALAHIPHQCTVDTAENACEALEKLASLGTAGGGGFDLIITDLIMPHMNGQAFTNTVRMLYSNIPIIWITSHRTAETEAQAQELGVYCCLDKPISLALMRHVVWEALETAGA